MVEIKKASDEKTERFKKLIGTKATLIEELKQEIEFIDTELNIMVQHPKILKPNFAFEDTDEYQALQVKRWTNASKNKKKDIQFQIDEQEGQIKEMKKDMEN